MIGVTYGSFNMQDPDNGFWVTKTNVYDPPANRIQVDKIAEADGGVVVQQQFESKTFTVEGIIRKDTIEELETALDVFKAAMASKNQAFDIEYAGGIRRYLANTKTNVIAKQLTSAAYSIEFICPDGVGWSLDTTELVAPTTISSSVASTAIDVLGSYKAEPLITVYVNAVSGGTGKKIAITNDSTLRGISVTRNWVAGDILEINSERRTLYVNNVAVDFEGQFPRWEPGAGALGYLDDFTTSRDVSITAVYTRRWL